MKINTEKLEETITIIDNSKKFIENAKDSLNSLTIPSDYPAVNKIQLTTTRDTLDENISELEKLQQSIKQTISDAITADRKSADLANSLMAAIGSSIAIGIDNIKDTLDEKVNEIKQEAKNVEISKQAGSETSSANVNNYSGSSNLGGGVSSGGNNNANVNNYPGSSNLGGGISSGGNNNANINNSGSIHYDTPETPNDDVSQVKFFDPTTGEQLIKSERVDGKDVFIDVKTGEVITDLGAGGPEWSSDVAYLEEMRQKAREIGSETGWLCIVDRDNFKTTVLIFLDGDWRVVKTYDCGTGRKGIEGIAESHTFTGTFKVDHKTDHGGPDDWWTCFIPYYKPDGTDFGQGFHEGYTGVPSYQSYGCTRLTTENAQWIYYNVPINSTVIVF